MIPDDRFITVIPDHRRLRDRWRIDNGWFFDRRVGDRRVGDRRVGDRRFFDRRIDNGWLHKRRIGHRRRIRDRRRRGRTGIRGSRADDRARVHRGRAGVRRGRADDRSRDRGGWAGVRGGITGRVTPDGSSHNHATIGPDDSGNIAGDLRPRVRDVPAGLRGAFGNDLHSGAVLPAGKRNAAQVVREDDGSRRGQGN
ncbi:hypothetical protein [Rhodococcus koreensis]|uniref:hypothetical protein n=1 Tax=Rhodococcus koreensis TaxID=99653 RepID=UPI0011614854|nr:hypothetical protein [Rhodococcus koreensis]